MLFVNCGDLFHESQTNDHQEAAREALKSASHSVSLGKTVCVSDTKSKKNPNAKWFATSDLLETEGLEYEDDGPDILRLI